MIDIEKQKSAYILFTVLGISVLQLTLFEIVLGQEAFMLFLYMILGPLGTGLILGLCALALIAVTQAFQCKEDSVLYLLGIITIPFTVFAADNVLYFFPPLVVANDTVEVITISYSIACIVAGIRFALGK